MSLENIFAAKAATVAEATGYLSPLAPHEVTATPPPSTIAQQTIQATLRPLIPVSLSTQETVPAGITLTAEQWAVYSSTQARIAELEAAEQRRNAEAQAAEVKALASEGPDRAGIQSTTRAGPARARIRTEETPADRGTRPALRLRR